MVEHAVAPRLQQELREMLIRERERLQRSIGRLVAAERELGESQGEESDAGGEPGDVASDLVEQAVDRALHRGEAERLSAVEAALQRMADGAYGICEDCGGLVGTERLYVQPWAALCIHCASRAARNPAPEGR